MPHIFSRLVAASPLLLLAALATGCSHISVFAKHKIVQADQQNPAAEIVSLWQPAKGPGLNNVPGRGLAGQILFFTRGNSSPVVVEGDVRVYLFDNQGTAEQQAEPIWQFDFPAQDWQNFASMGTLGPSYNIFVPYVREGQQQVECAIQIRFTPKAGPVIYSEMTPVTLPGKIDAADGGFLPEKSPRLSPPAPLNVPGEAKRLAVDPNRMQVQTIRPTKPAPGQIVQASHAEDGGAFSPANNVGGVMHADYTESQPPLPAGRDQRLEELERYVRQLQAERDGARAPVVEEAYEEFAVEGEPAAPRRLRLTPAARMPASRATGEPQTSEWDAVE